MGNAPRAQSWRENVCDASFALLSQATWPCLEEACFDGTEISATGLQHVINAAWPLMKSLDFWDCDPCGLDLAQLAQGQWPLLEKLCLHKNNITEDGMLALVEANYAALTVLDVSCWVHTPETISILMTGNWPKLQCLEIAEEMDDELVEQLCPGHGSEMVLTINRLHSPQQVANGQWPSLRFLILSDSMSVSLHDSFGFNDEVC